MAGTVIDAHILAVVQIFGYLVTALGSVFGVSAFVGTRRIRHLTQSLTFGLAGALIIGPAYLHFFAHGSELSHPFTTAPLYLGLIQGFLSGVLGGQAPILARNLARYHAIRARRVARMHRMMDRLREREGQMRDLVATTNIQVAENRATAARLRSEIASEVAAIEQVRPRSSRERQQLAARRANVERAQRGLNELESQFTASEQGKAMLQGGLLESQQVRRQAHKWEHDVMLPHLPFTVSGFLRSWRRLILAGFLLGAVAGIFTTHELGQALLQGLWGAVLSAILFLNSMQLHSNSARVMGPVLATNYKSRRRPPVFVGRGLLLGAAVAALPALLLIPADRGHLTDQLIVLAADTLAGGVAGAVALRVRYWADRLSDRHYALTGLVLVLVGLAVAIFTQPVLTLLAVRVQ